MYETFDLAIIGAGPAGLAATLRARAAGLSVLLVDDQPEPGGQIFRAIERRAADLYSAEDRQGLELVQKMRASGADYRPSTQVWQIEEGRNLFLRNRLRGPEMVSAKAILIATGAQERPVPFPGWTLPGVTTLGAAQIMLKSAGQIPQDPVWIAGSGPLVLLYAVQLLDAGGQVAGFLDTSPTNAPARPALAAALRSLPDLARGLGWMRRLRGLPVWRGVTKLEGIAGDDGALAELRFSDASGHSHSKAAGHLLVHEGVVPRWTIARALRCDMAWNEASRAFEPRLDDWCMTSQAGIFCAGDGAGISGARAAVLQGQIAALGVLRYFGGAAPEAEAAALRKSHDRARALRPFLDRRYAPREASPSDETILCRCENLTAGDIRAAVRAGAGSTDQVKAYTRSGMGPCQGRQCGYAVAALVAAETGRAMGDCGLYRVRSPFQPITLGELAQLYDKVEK